MSKPSSGPYRIINRVLSVQGKPLAITFNGEGQPATVTFASDSQNQIWILRDYNSKTQSVTPVEAQSLQAAWGSGFVTVLPAGGYVWTIRETSDGVTIQDGGVTVFWGVANAAEGAEVTIGGGTGSIEQRWVLEKA